MKNRFATLTPAVHPETRDLWKRRFEALCAGTDSPAALQALQTFVNSAHLSVDAPSAQGYEVHMILSAEWIPEKRKLLGEMFKHTHRCIVDDVASLKKKQVTLQVYDYVTEGKVPTPTDPILISGGFPCQDVSTMRSDGGDRHAVRDHSSKKKGVKPLLLFENVLGLDKASHEPTDRQRS